MPADYETGIIEAPLTEGGCPVSSELSNMQPPVAATTVAAYLSSSDPPGVIANVDEFGAEFQTQGVGFREDQL